MAGEKNFVVGVQPAFTWFPDAPKVVVPEGFTPIFNGQNLTGWHASPTNHHGVTPDFRVVHGAIVGTQSPWGDGGILLTDKSYKNFELYMEVRPDYGCDSGIFLRSTQSGRAYQITMDYLPGGSMGSLITENINGTTAIDRASLVAAGGKPPAQAARAGQAAAGARAGAAAGGQAGARAGAAAGGQAGARRSGPILHWGRRAPARQLSHPLSHTPPHDLFRVPHPHLAGDELGQEGIAQASKSARLVHVLPIPKEKMPNSSIKCVEDPFRRNRKLDSPQMGNRASD